MSDATKIPFEPIPVPPLGPLPAMPSLADPAKPSFSRSTLPPAAAPRKAIIDDDMIPLSKFLPAGIAPEAPEQEQAEATPAAGGSWLRRKRMQLLFGAVSLGGAAYGLQELAPSLKPQNNVEQPSEVAKAPVTPLVPKIAEERGHELPKPSVEFERHAEPKLLPIGVTDSEPKLLPIGERKEEPAPLRLTAGVTPITMPALPTEIQTPTPPAITLPPVGTSTPPAIVPITVPESPAPVLPPVTLNTPPAVPELKPLTLPKVESTPPAIVPVLPPVEIEKPKPTPIVPVVETPKPAPALIPVPTPIPAPVELPKPAALPAPAPAVVPTPLPVPGTSPVAVLPLTQPETPKPVVPSEPKTDYDVDVHRVRSTETYQSLSEKYYGSAQYAGALKAYNRGAELGQLRDVNVPPMFVIRKMVPTSATATPAPAPSNEIVPAGAEPAWTGVGAPKNGGDVRFETYRVPRAGMTMRDVAKAVYGRESEWPRVDNRRNIKYRPDEELPVGAELQVPVERPDWR